MPKGKIRALFRFFLTEIFYNWKGPAFAFVLPLVLILLFRYTISGSVVINGTLVNFYELIIPMVILEVPLMIGLTTNYTLVDGSYNGGLIMLLRTYQIKHRLCWLTIILTNYIYILIMAGSNYLLAIAIDGIKFDLNLLYYWILTSIAYFFYATITMIITKAKGFRRKTKFIFINTIYSLTLILSGTTIPLTQFLVTIGNGYFYLSFLIPLLAISTIIYSIILQIAFTSFLPFIIALVALLIWVFLSIIIFVFLKANQYDIEQEKNSSLTSKRAINWRVIKVNNKKILQNISLNFEPGFRLLVAGKNGAGKTTLINSLITYDVFKENYSVVPQELFFNMHLKIKHIFFLFQTMSKSSQETLAFWISYFNLEGVLNKRFGLASGGEQKKIALVFALLNEPEIIIADEIKTSLDINSQNKIDTLFGQFLKNPHHALLLINHEDDLTTAFCNRLITIQDGTIKEKSLNVS